MDVLSDILSLIRLRSVVYFKSDFCTPWGMEIPPAQIAQFHIVVRGHCELIWKEGRRKRTIYGGDVVVFPFGHAHQLADDPRRICRSGDEVMKAIQEGKSFFDGPEPSASLICGHFEWDRGFAHPLIQSLPEILHLQRHESSLLSSLGILSDIVIQETGSDLPGAELVSQRLSEVLFIQVLRAYMHKQTPTEGFISALRDKHIHHSLQLIHKQPSTKWTLALLAQEIGLSRTLFAVRFREMTGHTPMNYLTDWRMYKARDMLMQDVLSLGEIADRVGYQSEAAFHRAFKKKFSLPPGRFRQAAQA